MNAKEIISDYLLKNGYEGLFNEDADCGCPVNDDFMSCSGEMCVDCQPGYRLPGNEEYDFLIGPKPEDKENL